MQQQNRKTIKTFLVTLTIILFLSLSAGGIYLATKSKESENKETPPEQIISETEKLVGEVGKVLELPKDETPTIATVTDTEKVKGQIFFEQAEQGDKVLVYIRYKKAILYRPSEKKIIEVGSINTEETAQISTQASP